MREFKYYSKMFRREIIKLGVIKMKDNQTLTIINKECKEIPVIDSREVAKMLESKHYKILEKLEGTKDGKTKGIISILAAHDFVVSNYFIESSYKDKSGKENKC